MIGSDLVDHCEERFGDTANTVVTAAQWLGYINDAYMAVVSAAASWTPPAHFLEGRASNTITTVDAGEITLPADAYQVTAVFNDTDNTPLELLDGRADYHDLYPDPAANLGTPVHYRLRANVLQVFPWPAVSTLVLLDYIVTPVALTTSTEPVFPEQYHRMLVPGAMAYAYEDDGNSQQAGTHQGRFDKMLAEMQQAMTASRGERYPQFTDTWG